MTTLKDIQHRVGVPADGVWGPVTAEAVARALGMKTALVSARGEALVKEFEGCRLEAYPDPGSGGDPWTIGYGATGEGIRKGVTWTREQCDERLREDLNRFAVGVEKALAGAVTSQNEFDAMVSLAFNVGLGNFQSSTLLRKHRAGDREGAAAEFARWNRAAGRVLAGLTRRRAAEAKLYRGMA